MLKFNLSDKRGTSAREPFIGIFRFDKKDGDLTLQYLIIILISHL